MDLFKQFQFGIYDAFGIKHPHYIKNHNEDKKNKKLANKIARRKLKDFDKKELDI